MNEAVDSPNLALEMLGIRKVYGATEVLHGVDLQVRPGSIHALVGANGAGKSTLLKIADGATAATTGRILVNGLERQFASPVEARRSGIGMVFQERSLLPDLSVADNIFLNDEVSRAGWINWRAEVRESSRIFDRLRVRISPAALVGQLGVGDQQMVEIAKALRLATSVLILDEPTAALSEREVQRLFTVARQIASSGVGIVYVSHRIAEVFELCDEVTVLRDGRVVLTAALADTDMRRIVEAIAGGVVREMHGPSEARGQELDQPPMLGWPAGEPCLTRRRRPEGFVPHSGRPEDGRSCDVAFHRGQPRSFHPSSPLRRAVLQCRAQRPTGPTDDRATPHSDQG